MDYSFDSDINRIFIRPKDQVAKRIFCKNRAIYKYVDQSIALLSRRILLKQLKTNTGVHNQKSPANIYFTGHYFIPEKYILML
jgi:hypothetical protein